MTETCRITRHPPAPLVEVIADPGLWRASLAGLVDTIAEGGAVLTVSPERRLVRLAEGVSIGAATTALVTAGARVVDVGHAWRPISLAGSGARALLERGVDLDLDPARFPVGTAASTLCARVPVILHAAEADLFRLFVATSWADWFDLWLDDARALAGL